MIGKKGISNEFCGQTQPHAAHEWARRSGNVYMPRVTLQCAGTTGEVPTAFVQNVYAPETMAVENSKKLVHFVWTSNDKPVCEDPDYDDFVKVGLIMHDNDWTTCVKCKEVLNKKMEEKSR